MHRLTFEERFSIWWLEHPGAPMLAILTVVILSGTLFFGTPTGPPLPATGRVRSIVWQSGRVGRSRSLMVEVGGDTRMIGDPIGRRCQPGDRIDLVRVRHVWGYRYLAVACGPSGQQ